MRDPLIDTDSALLLGLCPLLVITRSVVDGLALGIAAMLVLALTAVPFLVPRDGPRSRESMISFALIIAPSIAGIELAVNAYFHSFYARLGIYLPMVAVSCALIGAHRADCRSPVTALFNALRTGAGFALALTILGGTRELLAHGTLLAGSGLLFGAHGLTIALMPDKVGFTLAALPPGAFIVLGLLIAARNFFRGRRHLGMIQPRPDRG